MTTTHGRVLATNTYYDTIKAKFISNLYSYDDISDDLCINNILNRLGYSFILLFDNF